MGGELSETDVFIAGGGPAGLAAAIAIRQHGLRVVVADFACPPHRQGLRRRFNAQYRDGPEGAGSDVPPRAGDPLSRNSIYRGRKICRGGLPKGIWTGNPADHPAQHPRRESCRRRAQLLWGTRVTGLGRGEVYLGSRRIQSRWIVGADGQNSQVHKWAGLVVVDATSGDSGSHARDHKMHKEVLESAQYPEVTFAPDQAQGQVSGQADSQVQV